MLLKQDFVSLHIEQTKLPGNLCPLSKCQQHDRQKQRIRNEFFIAIVDITPQSGDKFFLNFKSNRQSLY